MKSFNQALDIKLSEQVINENEFGNLTIALFSYDNKPPKLQISRYKKEQDKLFFQKMGRLSKSEIEKLIPALEKILAQM